MKYGQFLSALRKNPDNKIFLLVGKEVYFIEKAEKRILQLLLPDEEERKNSVRILPENTGIGEIGELLETTPFFQEKNVVLIRNPEFFNESFSEKNKAKKFEQFIELLKNMSASNNLIVEIYDKPDRRKKLYKVFESLALVLDADEVKYWELNDWLRDRLKELKLEFDTQAEEYFINAYSLMNPISLNFLDEELKKLTLLKEKNRFTRREVEKILSSSPEISGFAIVEAMSKGDKKKAIKLLERQISEGTYLPIIVAILAREIKQYIQAKALIKRGIRGQNLASVLGGEKSMKQKIADKIVATATKHSRHSLKMAYLSLASADYFSKVGLGGEEFMEKTVINLCDM